MNLEHDGFLNGVVEASQSFIFHVVDCTSIFNGEVGVGNGNDGIGSGDGVIQFKVGYNELNLIKTLVRMKKSCYKLKNRHVMKNYLWNWSVTKKLVQLE
jgi:hypothetical protein